MPDPKNAVPTALMFSAIQANPSRYSERDFVSGLMGSRNRWNHYPARLLRYAVAWAQYEGSVYRNVHLWSQALKLDRDAWDTIRGIGSPAKLIVDFWASYLCGGTLDMNAGDGKEIPSALPIVTEHEYLRPLIGRLWTLSRWQAKKNIYARVGGCKGDVFLQVVDEPATELEDGSVEREGRVYFVVRDPSTLYSVTKDAQGNIKGYTITEQRPDPESVLNDFGGYTLYCTYIEICDRDADGLVRYRTYRNSVNEPYGWDGRESEWTQDYGFVPMVHVQFDDIGEDYGAGCLYGSEDKLFETDDMRSRINDQVFQIVDPPWYIAGGDPSIKIGKSDDGGRGDRASKRFVFGKEGTVPTAMIVDLDLGDAVTMLESQDAMVIRDHPEIASEDISPNASGESRKVAREQIESKVVEKRGIFDPPLVTIHEMAIDIWRQKGYPGPDGKPLIFPEDAYQKGLYKHSIGSRPVFAVSEETRLDLTGKQASAARDFSLAGFPLETIAELIGLPEEQIQAALKAKEQADNAAADQAAKDQQAVYQGNEGG